MEYGQQVYSIPSIDDHEITVNLGQRLLDLSNKYCDEQANVLSSFGFYYSPTLETAVCGKCEFPLLGLTSKSEEKKDDYSDCAISSVMDHLKHAVDHFIDCRNVTFRLSDFSRSTFQRLSLGSLIASCNYPFGEYLSIRTLCENGFVCIGKSRRIFCIYCGVQFKIGEMCKNYDKHNLDCLSCFLKDYNFVQVTDFPCNSMRRKFKCVKCDKTFNFDYLKTCFMDHSLFCK